MSDAWPDIVQRLVAYLDPTIGTPVASRVPKQRPARFIQVRRVGGPADPPVRDRPRIDIICWAPQEPDAWADAAFMREAMWALPGDQLGDVTVYTVSEFMGPRQDDDPLTGTPLVWATYDLNVRADLAIHAPVAPLEIS